MTPVALCSKLNVGTHPSRLEWPWEIRPPNKNFCCYQTFLIKKGVGLALGKSLLITEQLQRVIS